jgi:DNA mismatch endonuclease (patch repair protein)
MSLPNRTKGRTVSLGGGIVVPYPEPTSAAATSVGRANAYKTTRPEVALRSLLHRSGLRFRKQKLVRCSNGVRVRPDVVFAGARVAVFVDGCFWHCCPLHGSMPTRNQAYWAPKLAANVERDRRAYAALTADGWHVERIWDHEAGQEAAGRVAAVVQARRGPRVL